MDYHKNAPWTAISRERLARLVIRRWRDRLWRRQRPGSASVAKTAAKWVGRYRQSGGSPAWAIAARVRTAVRVRPVLLLVEKVLALRRGHMPGYEIARRTGLSPASVSRILRRAKLSRWRDLNPPPPIQRYEHPGPATCCTWISRE